MHEDTSAFHGRAGKTARHTGRNSAHPQGKHVPSSDSAAGAKPQGRVQKDQRSHHGAQRRNPQQTGRVRHPRREQSATFKPFTPQQLAARAAAIPLITYPEDLPVSTRRDVIADAIRDHQVVIVSGETGSGKTTQLPKICLQLGRGVRGMIGHTQPRRLAAHTVAERIAQELGQTVGKAPGQVVGYQVRFTEEVGPTTLIKLMTDGILLSEIQSDPLLKRYDTLIIDEAHERSLNIDFILGYLARLLPLRPDLKVVITSATIDSKRFAEHFGRWERQGKPLPPGAKGAELIEPAPVVEVSGRTYPVEIRYRPLTAEREWHSDQHSGVAADHAHQPAPATDQSASADAMHVQQLVLENPDSELATMGYGLGDDLDQEQAICAAVDELITEGPGDILVFLPGERDIRETEQALVDHLKSGAHTRESIEILPLFARLTSAEQHRVFEAHHHRRRVVLATNVAETSLTVPGIRYVIDPGLARISRYSNRTKVQRLPIEPVSQASANQRAGRCGRVADGVAIRLYSQEDFETRPAFTEPEILRTSLASVILQMAALGLGSVADFPFLDPPDGKAVRDGIQLLVEIGALTAESGGRTQTTAPGLRTGYRLTAIGRDLARLPIDPRLGRMLIEADGLGCASEVLVIVAALSIQDVRERPLDHQQAADQAHARFTDPHSDFITYLNLWRYLGTRQRDLSGSRFRKMCRAEFLHYLRFREWRDVVTQLRQMAKPLDLQVHPIGLPEPRDVARSGGDTARAAVEFGLGSRSVDADQVHRALLVGLLSNLGNWNPAGREYQGTRGTRFVMWPGSGLAHTHPEWVMTAELVETSRLFARTVARIRPEWIEPLAGPLLKYTYSEPYWSAAKGAAMCKEKVLLYGLTLVADRPVMLGRLDVTFGGAGDAPRMVRAGTLAGLAQGLRGRGEDLISASTSVADALSSALAALGLEGDRQEHAIDSTTRVARNGSTDHPQPADIILETNRANGSSRLSENPASAAQTRENNDEQVKLADSGSAQVLSNGNAAAVNNAPDIRSTNNGHAKLAAGTSDSGVITARELAREMFIRHALVGGEWRDRHPFRTKNDELLEQAKEVERRSRTHGVVASEEARYRFFDDIVPDWVTSGGNFNRWWKRARQKHPDLLIYPMDLLMPPERSMDPAAFPDHVQQGDLRLPLSYQFKPGSTRDGVTMTIPVQILPRVVEMGTDWLVPGMVAELCTEMIRALPKNKRRLLAPAPEVGGQVAHILSGSTNLANEPPIQAGQDHHAASEQRGETHPSAPQNMAADKRHTESKDSAQPDPRSLDAALSRLSAWGAKSGTRITGNPTAEPIQQPVPKPDVPSPDQNPVQKESHRPMPFDQAFKRAVESLRDVQIAPEDLAYAHDHLPDYLQMTFVVVDRDGTELGSGKSLPYLQKTLGKASDRAVRSAVRDAVADALQRQKRTNKQRKKLADALVSKHSEGQASARPDNDSTPGAWAQSTSLRDTFVAENPAAANASNAATPKANPPTTNLPDANALNANDLTDFPARPLPRQIERLDGQMLLRGYPALVPQGSAAHPTAGVRVMANSAEADHLFAQGLAHLLLAQVQLGTARVTTRWFGRQALMLAASPYPNTADLVADAQLASAKALVEDLSGPHGPSAIRSPEAFHQLVAKARDLHEDRVYQIVGHVVNVLEALSQVQDAMREHSAESLAPVVSDVRQVVEALVTPGFIARTPAWALPHVARFVKAGAVRIIKVARGSTPLPRDAENQRVVQDMEDLLESASEVAATRPFNAEVSARLESAQWMIQELRVSLFAQQLGTPQKVSAKRVRNLIESAQSQ